MVVFRGVLVAPLLVWGGPVVDLVLGHKYGRSATLLKELTPYVYLWWLNALVVFAVNFMGVARRRVPIAVADLVVSAGLTAALLPAIGLSGAAWASDVVPLFYVPAHIWIIRRLIDLPLRPFFVSGARGLVAAGAMALGLLPFATSPPTPLEWVGGGGPCPARFAGTLAVTRAGRLPHPQQFS